MSERDYQKFLIEEFEKMGAWAQNIHPSAGMRAGIPDLFVQHRHGCFWLELKFGQIVGEWMGKDLPRFVPTDMKLEHPLQPQQGKWARRMREAGGRSYVLVGAQELNVHGEFFWKHFLIEPFVDNQMKRSFSMDEIRQISLNDFGQFSGN